VLGAWIGAVVLGAVVLAFCGYELAWKSRRLHTDLEHLAVTRNRLSALQREVAAVQRRLADVSG
jgi:cytochrome c-type biogenesis protein CcmH/NrfG